MNPEPSTDTASFRTRRHPRGDLEIGLLVPNAGVVDAEDGEVFRLDFGDVGFVCDRECASFQVPQTLSVVDRPEQGKIRISHRGVRKGSEDLLRLLSGERSVSTREKKVNKPPHSL